MYLLMCTALFRTQITCSSNTALILLNVMGGFHFKMGHGLEPKKKSATCTCTGQNDFSKQYLAVLTL